jgi:hypothetical protein
MMAANVLSAHDMGGDVLLVTGTVDGLDVQAQGWVSAFTNHFDEHHYSHDEDGNLTRAEDAQPREMTAEERLSYCERLLIEQNPVPVDLGIASA